VALPDVGLSAEDVVGASARLARFAPYLSRAFPETAVTGGIIESDLRPLPVDRRKCVSVSLGNVSILDAQLRKRENLSNFQVVSTCEGKVSPPLPGKNVAAGVAVGLLVRYAMPLNERLSSDHPIPDGIIPSNAQGIVE
jgi:hypothetical protein